MEYANIAAESEGTATSKYNAAYLDSIEAKVNELTAAWQSFSMTLLDSSMVKTVVEVLTEIVGLLDEFISLGDGEFVPFIVGIPAAIALVIKSFRALKKETALTATATGNNIAKIGEDIKKEATTITGEVAAAGTAVNSEIISASNEAVTSMSTSGQLIEKNTTTRWQKIKTTIAKGVKGLGKTIVAALPAILPSILAFISSFDTADAKISTAVLGIAGVVVMGISLINKSVRAFMASNPIGWILGVLSAVAMAAMAIIDLVPSYDKAKEKAEEAKAAWEESAQALDETNSKLDELNTELKELNDIPNKSITDENDIARLEREIALLKEKQEIQEAAEENLQKEAEQAGAEAYQMLAYGDISDTELSNAKDAEKWFDKNKEELGLDSTQDLVSYALKHWNEVDENDKSVIPEEVRTFVTDWLNEANELTGDFEYGNDIVVDGIIDTVTGLNESFYLQEKGVEAYWENLKAKGDYTDGIEAIETFANGFKKSSEITSGALEELANKNTNVAKVFDHLKEIGAWDGDWASLALFVQDLRTGLGELAELSMTDDIELVSSKFDALSGAIEEAKENGIISLETLKTLMEEAPNELNKYFQKTKDGYVLGGEAIDKTAEEEKSSFDIMKEVANAEIAEYQKALQTAQGNLAGLEEEDDDYEMALKNLATAQDNLNTKVLEWSTILRDLKVEEETEKLEKKKEALEEQLDIYKELVDIRKDILETYQEEVSYQKELNRKQANVATLQAQLAAARLDNSAEGQARQRELENELQTAQEELDEYTLERAIQDITVSMDNEYAEYEAFIQEEVEKITNQIDGIATTVKEILGAVEGYVTLSDSASDMYSLYEQIKKSGVSYSGNEATKNFMDKMASNNYAGAAETYRGASSWYNENKPKAESNGSGGGDGQEKKTINPSDLTLIEDAEAYNFNYKDKNDWGHIDYEGSKYYLANATQGGAGDEILNAAKARQFTERAVFKYGDDVYAMTNSGETVIRLKDRNLGKGELKLFKDATGKYHTGGFVGDLTSLKSNEEFAKLLKGEFVSTPAQMDNFMKNVLPQVTSYSTGATINNNSPLVTIQCGTIDDETLPKLTQMVDAAVTQIERNMENALTRRGYRSRA